MQNHENFTNRSMIKKISSEYSVPEYRYIGIPILLLITFADHKYLPVYRIAHYGRHTDALDVETVVADVRIACSTKDGPPSEGE